jgi:hypothetical protein
MGKVISIFDKTPLCVVCHTDSERLVFNANVCHRHAVAVATFMIETHRAMQIGDMDWDAIRRIVDNVAAHGLQNPSKEIN